jgi:hypothetical protein
MYMTHTETDLDVLHMHENRTRKSFQWNWSQVQIKLDSTRIVKTSSISSIQLVQELSTLKLMSRSHTTSNWGVLRLLLKVKRYNFQWNFFHVQIDPESMEIIETIKHPESILVLRHHFWPLGRVLCPVH